MRAFGRFLQLLGLVLLPLAMFLELTKVAGNDFGQSKMFVMMIFGACVFYMGRMLEGYARG